VITSFDSIVAEAKSLPPLPVAVIDAADEHVLEGAVAAWQAGLVIPTLIGDRTAIQRLVRALPASASLPIVPASTDNEAVEAGVALARAGTVQALMKGHIETSDFLRPIIAGLRGPRRISHVFVAEVARYPKLLFITDGAVNIAPDLTTKAAILQNVVDLVRLLGAETVKVAALSAVELVNPSIPSTIDAACLGTMAARGQIHGAIVDGPLAFDNAISKEAAAIKGIRAVVSGDVDVLLVPDIVSGNILAKALEYLAGATLAGIVLGAQVPIVLTSRADPVRARLVSAALACILQRAADETAHERAPRASPSDVSGSHPGGAARRIEQSGAPASHPEQDRAAASSAPCGVLL
jgi:phosphotransacetylase